jgi:catalase
LLPAERHRNQIHRGAGLSMLFLTRLFGVTGSEAERDLGAEEACIEAIVEKVLAMQTNAAVEQHRPLGRGTHAKGTCARAVFEVYDVKSGRDASMAARLARGIFAAPGIYPATVRFANSDPKVNSDFKADVRSLSFSVDLTRDGAVPPGTTGRQDFSLQNTTTLPINDAHAFLAIMKLLTASNPAAGLWALPFKDKLRVLRTLALVQVQTHQRIRPYQQLRYGSNVPFRHGPDDVVKYAAIPLSHNPAQSLQRHSSNALQDELIRHLNEDLTMSSFDFGVQFLDAGRMTYWGKRLDASFWTENASVEWQESKAPFHTVGRLTLLAKSELSHDGVEASYFDVTGNAVPDSTPVGSINRARQRGEVASRKARMRAAQAKKP